MRQNLADLMASMRQMTESLLHRYIRTGEALMLDGELTGPVTVEGWGKYAAVRVGAGAIRRDGIRRDERGRWFYRFDE